MGSLPVQSIHTARISPYIIHVVSSLARIQVLSGASLEVKQGTFHILLGPNGCGKSTLLRVLGGLLQSDSGSYQLAGPVGFVFQNPDHQVVMPTVAADVAFGLGRSVIDNAAKAIAVVQLNSACMFMDFKDKGHGKPVPSRSISHQVNTT